MVPEIKYTKTSDVQIAYQTLGKGPIDLILVPGWVSNIEVFWEEPNIVRFFRKLAGFSRFIIFDKRGTGLSDRGIEAATLEERMDDVRAVLDAVGSHRAALLGYSEGGAMCTLFAATYPDRTEALITIGSYARRLRAPDYPYFADREETLKAVDAAAAAWGGPVWIDTRLPSVAHDPLIRQWWARFLRMSASASAAAALQRLNIEIDVRHVLPSIRVPTLVLHAAKDRAIPFGAGQYMAACISNAKFVEVDGVDHLPFYDKSDIFVQHIQAFLTGSARPAVPESRVSTLMCTDIVESTQMAFEKGNLRFGDLLEAHHKAIRSVLAQYRGEEINTAGDSFLASFDGPARAIKCALAIVDSLGAIGIACRIGLHTGECEIRQGQLHGIALNIAARVAALASPREVFVTQTVKDLVAGSDLTFVDAGLHTLKGMPGEMELYAVVDR